jgi:hypothetical protein
VTDELAQQRRQLPVRPQSGYPPITSSLVQVIAQEHGIHQPHTRAHTYLKSQIANHARATHDVEVAMEGDLPWADECVLEPFDLAAPDMRARAHGVFDESVR